MTADIKATGKGVGIGSILLGVFVLALLLAIGWSVFTFLLGAMWLAVKIAIVLLVVLGVLVLVGMVRTHVLKR